MIRKYSISFFVAVVLIIPITVFGLVNWIERNYKALPVYEGDNFTLVDFKLTNQHGSAIGLDDWKGRIVVVDFFFTSCPVICPKMTKNLKKVQAAYQGENDLQINSFSVDPVRDSARQLESYAEKFGISGNWNLLTGDKIEIYRLARKSFSVVATDGDGGPEDFIHSESLVLIDKNQRIRGYYKGTSDKEVEQLIIDIKKLKDEN